MQGKTLFLYNTAHRSKERFEPLHDPVSLYCCGPTVYNYAHIGNLRTYIFEDVLKRTLVALGYNVRHIINITDVGHLTSDEDTGEDKMEKGAKREGGSVWDIAVHFTQTFMHDIALLNILPPDKWPKATDHIPQMIDLVEKLEGHGFTYKTSDGIYFDTAKFPSYAAFAGLDTENLRAGERVEMGEKRSVTDFALWKFSPKEEKRQMEWESPWGIGFPGWHIECSAMSLAYLPQPIDIHCGGADHIRVHHTNEIAQAEAATGKTFVRYWLHGEFLVFEKGKMAKSGDHFITMATLRQKDIAPLAYRMFCYTAHYRTPLSFSWDALAASAQSLTNLRRVIGSLSSQSKASSPSVLQIASALDPFYTAVADDLNMPRAVAALWDIVRNESLDAHLRRVCAEQADNVLGLELGRMPAETVQTVVGADGATMRLECTTCIPLDICDKLTAILSERRRARREKDYTAADRIRQKLGAAGIIVKDQPDGSTTISIPAGICTDDDKKALIFMD
ncbi:MAG: cysteine--tRNA ligase [Chitinispirillaceae bacterium]|nr:cysteine--tRNA ligase [Chitinispirillaceae bacterium]